MVNLNVNMVNVNKKSYINKHYRVYSQNLTQVNFLKINKMKNYCLKFRNYLKVNSFYLQEKMF